MKRYRVHYVDFDTRPAYLALEIKDDWEEDIRHSHFENKENLLSALKQEFGDMAFEQKKKNFIDLDSIPMSFIAFHNKFLHQIRDSFVIGGYYPALTGTCALGERILNRLVLSLRDDFSKTPEYKKVYDKDSFDDWGLAINVLDAWGVLLPNTIKAFRALAAIRNQTIHFEPEVDKNDRELALKAIKLLHEIIGDQFSAFGLAPWFITDIPGECYIKKDWEDNPFVRKICIPNCVYVGPQHVIEVENNRFVIRDIDSYEMGEVTDDGFVKLRRDFSNSQRDFFKDKE